MHKIFEVIEATQKVIDNQENRINSARTIDDVTSQVEAELQEKVETISKLEAIRDRYVKDNNSLTDIDKAFLNKNVENVLNFIGNPYFFIYSLDLTIKNKKEHLEAMTKIERRLKKQKPDNSTTSSSHTTDTSPSPSGSSKG